MKYYYPVKFHSGLEIKLHCTKRLKGHTNSNQCWASLVESHISFCVLGNFLYVLWLLHYCFLQQITSDNANGKSDHNIYFLFFLSWKPRHKVLGSSSDPNPLHNHYTFIRNVSRSNGIMCSGCEATPHVTPRLSIEETHETVKLNYRLRFWMLFIIRLSENLRHLKLLMLFGQTNIYFREVKKLYSKY